jgi:hypothetical protein
MTEATTAPVPPEGIGKLAAAFVKAQAKLTNPPKTKIVHAGQKKYAFAPLPEIMDHVRPVLEKNGLAIMQMVGENGLETRLIHESGESVKSVYPMPKFTDSQAMGSAISYARRYSVCAILGIAGDDDNDAQGEADKEAEAEAERKAETARKMEELKAKGKITSAYTGEKVAPGESILPPVAPDPAPSTPKTKPPAKTKASPPATPPATPTADLAGIVPALAALMTESGITPAQLKAYYVSRGHMPATVEPSALPANYVESITKATNWTKIVAAIKNGAV